MIRDRMTAAPEAEEDIDEKSRPPEEKDRHKPVAKFQDVIDLKAMLGRVCRLPEELVDEREMQINHTAANLLR